MQAYADKAASAIAAAVAGADASLLASTGFTLAQAGIVVAAAALGAAAMRLFNREERKEMKTTRDEAVAKSYGVGELCGNPSSRRSYGTTSRRWRGAPEI